MTDSLPASRTTGSGGRSEMPLSIAMVVPVFPRVSETFILREITSLIELGHDVRIFAGGEPNNSVLHEQVVRYRLLDRTTYVYRNQGKMASRLRIAGLLLRVLSRAPSALRWLARSEILPSGRKLTRLARLRILLSTKNYDVVHCHYGHIALGYRFLAEHWQLPLVVTFHGVDCSEIPETHGMDIFEPVFQQAARVISRDAAMTRRLIELGCDPSRIRQIPTGVDASEFTTDRADNQRSSGTIKRGTLRVLTVGRLVEKKGIEFALRAIAVVANEGMKVEYRVIGDGPLRKSLEELADDLGIADHVAFDGALTQRDVRRALSSADIFMLSSVTGGGGDREGIPNVLLEAAAASLPIVSTHHGGIPEAVVDGRTGILVPERDSSALAGALRIFAGDPEKRIDFGRSGRLHIEENFDLRRLTQKLVATYRDALAEAT